MNPYIVKIRKKLWFPTKFKLLRRKYINEMNVRPRSEIWDRLQEEKANLIQAQMGIDGDEVKKHETIINTLNWIINDST